MRSRAPRSTPATGTGTVPAAAGAAAGHGDAPLALEDGLGFRLDRVQRGLRAAWAGELSALDLTPPLAAMLRGVREHPGTSVRALARVLGTDAMAVTRGVDDLEARGLVRTGPSPDDRRLRCIRATDAGRRTAAAVDDLLRRREAAFDTLSPRERRTFRDVLDHLERTLGATDEAPTSPGHDRNPAQGQMP